MYLPWLTRHAGKHGDQQIPKLNLANSKIHLKASKTRAFKFDKAMSCKEYGVAKYFSSICFALTVSEPPFWALRHLKNAGPSSFTHVKIYLPACGLVLPGIRHELDLAKTGATNVQRHTELHYIVLLWSETYCSCNPTPQLTSSSLKISAPNSWYCETKWVWQFLGGILERYGYRTQSCHKAFR